MLTPYHVSCAATTEDFLNFWTPRNDFSGFEKFYRQKGNVNNRIDIRGVHIEQVAVGTIDGVVFELILENFPSYTFKIGTRSNRKNVLLSYHQ